MSESNLYYIYIDTCIDGAIAQLIGYFQTGVFNNKQCISVYCKYYKQIEKKFTKEFLKNNIIFKFIKKNSDLFFEDNKTVFYLFNAQSNCRVVAHRNVSHVFVTHGESHKISSIKPIIRIYDYIVTSGQVGVDRYLKAGIFNECDIQENRVIKLGDTFIGQNNYIYVPESKTLLYAPTWEGGIPSENYSSLGNQTAKILMQYVLQLNIRKVVIQPHPNLGHRDSQYLAYLDYIAQYLSEKNVIVYIRKQKVKFIERFKKNIFYYDTQMQTCAISYGITDISAMEIQLISKKIPVTVFVTKEVYAQLTIPNRIQQHYQYALHFIDVKQNQPKIVSVDQSYLDYIEDYHLPDLERWDWAKRISWLCHSVNEFKFKRAISRIEKY